MRQNIINSFLKNIEGSFSVQDYKKINLALKWCKKFHKGQKRLSGEDFFIHPLQVANILVQWQATPDMIIAAILHDSVEDTTLTLEEIEKKFGAEVSLFVFALTKENILGETLSKNIALLEDSPNSLRIKLADRLHNMRTIHNMSLEKQKEKSMETLSVYVPIARYLKIYDVAEELRSLSEESLHYKQAIQKFEQAVNNFRIKNLIYTNIKDLNNDIENIFCKNLDISLMEVVIFNKKDKKDYLHIVNFFKKNVEIINIKKNDIDRKVKKELLLFSSNIIKNNIEICLPLFNISGQLIGFLVLGRKNSNEDYLLGELSVIERMRSYLSAIVSGLLYNHKLEEEVKNKTENLQKQNEKIKGLLKQQKDFIAISAHELRTPLNIAMLQIEQLRKLLAKSDQQKIILINSIEDNVQKLYHLVQSIFDVQRYDLKKVPLHLETTDIGKFLAEFYKNFLPIMRKKSLNFSFENKINHKINIEIDAIQIHRVIQNILDNAVKFIPQGGNVQLSLQLQEKNIKICIIDNGKGIADEDKKIIFEKFKSNHPLQGKGIGLGLYICKKIIDLHEGKIWAEDSPYHGASFCILLPCKNVNF